MRFLALVLAIGTLACSASRSPVVIPPWGSASLSVLSMSPQAGSEIRRHNNDETVPSFILSGAPISVKKRTPAIARQRPCNRYRWSEAERQLKLPPWG